MEQTLSGQAIQLTRKLKISNGGHILYFYDDMETYTDNLVSFVQDGLAFGHHLLIIERPGICKTVDDCLRERLTEDKIRNIHYFDNSMFNGVRNDHFFERFFDHDRSIRTWVRLEPQGQEDLAKVLERHQKIADLNIRIKSAVTVCAHDGAAVAASLQTEMLRHHEYFMTDKELVRSPLYTSVEQKVIFPSLSTQAKIYSEVESYKSKLDFIHVVSHEVRNPLTIINAYASILRSTEASISPEGLLKIAEIQNYVKVIDHELTHIIETEQMLSNELYFKKEPVNLLPVIRDVANLMAAKAHTQRIEFTYDVNLGEHDRVIGNQTGLRLVISNLLSNAIKYSDLDGTVNFKAYQDSGQFNLVVEDNGVGMTKEQLKLLFRKYGKLNESRNGLGIGLYIVKQLVDYFQGTIQIKSEPGSGTTVEVAFPVYEEMR